MRDGIKKARKDAVTEAYNFYSTHRNDPVAQENLQRHAEICGRHRASNAKETTEFHSRRFRDFDKSSARGTQLCIYNRSAVHCTKQKRDSNAGFERQ